LRPLGRGGFGEVLLAQHKFTGELLAIKKIRIDSRSLTPKEVEGFFRESRNLQRLRHANIIELKNVFTVKHYLILMLEYLEGGDLQKYLKDRKA
jgi:serine/threonine protein kinase